MTPLPDIAIIGPGKVGVTIALAAKNNGYRIVALAGRNKKRAQEAANIIGNDIMVCAPFEAVREAQLILLTVTDEAIEPLCKELATNNAFSDGQIVAHCSGTLTSGILASARDLGGAEIASAHPLQTFPTVELAVKAMPGTFWFCEGDKHALEVLGQLIQRTGGKPNIIPSASKVLYHCALVIACNYLTSLMDVALNVAERANLDRQLAWRAFSPLIQSTIANIGHLGTASALTGPIARGDVDTVVRHLHALSDTNEEIAEIYKVLGNWTIQLAIQKGLSPERAEALSKEITTTDHLWHQVSSRGTS